MNYELKGREFQCEYLRGCTQETELLGLLPKKQLSTSSRILFLSLIKPQGSIKMYANMYITLVLTARESSKCRQRFCVIGLCLLQISLRLSYSMKPFVMDKKVCTTVVKNAGTATLLEHNPAVKVPDAVEGNRKFPAASSCWNYPSMLKLLHMDLNILQV